MYEVHNARHLKRLIYSSFYSIIFIIFQKCSAFDYQKKKNRKKKEKEKKEYATYYAMPS